MIGLVNSYQMQQIVRMCKIMNLKTYQLISAKRDKH